MKNILAIFLITTFFACKNSDETYRANIEGLATNWDAVNSSIGEFGSLVQTSASDQAARVASMVIDEKIFSKLKPEVQTQFAEAKATAAKSGAGYATILSELTSFQEGWTTKSADLQALKDGLKAGKLEGDIIVEGMIADLTSAASDASSKLETWKGALSTTQSTCNSANDALSTLIASLVTK